ncbi:MAG: hypothetical protein HUJ25_07835 [Crocinitomicaceae bacterium]|nr:hypothetical protein [Crocinitomicaceae bacterium]
MLVILYRSKTPVAVFSLPLLIGLLALPIFFYPQPPEFHFWNWQNELDQIVKNETVLNYSLTVTLISLIAHQLNNVYNRHSFYSKATFLPGFIYVFSLFTLNRFTFSPDLIAHLFMVFALGQFLKMRRQEDAKAIMFWSSFFLGIAMVFSTFSGGLVLLCWMSLVIFRPFVWRESFLVIMGFLVPLFYYMGIMFMLKGGFDFNIADPVEETEFNMDFIKATSYGVFGLIVLGSLYKYFIVMRNEVNRFRKQSMVIFHFLWISALVWFIGFKFFEHIYLGFLLPISFLVGTSFLHARRNSVINLVVIIWLIISAANVLIIR